MKAFNKKIKIRLAILSLSIALSACGSSVMDFNTSLAVDKNSQVHELIGHVEVSKEKIGTAPAYHPIAYEEDRLKAEFLVSSIGFKILITNKTEQPITMLWSEATIASDENNIAVPLLTSPLVKAQIYNKKINDKWRGHYQLNDQTIEPNLRRGINVKPDYSEVFSTWGAFNISGKDFSEFASDAFKDKKLILTVPVIDNNTRVEYIFSLTVIESKSRTSYY
jgi:hypothetical protein